MTGIGFEYSRVFLPRVNNGLVRRFPPERFEMLGKIESANEGEHMGFQALQVRVVEGLDRGFLDGAVHPLGLPVRPRVIGFGELVSNAIFIAHPAKDVHAQKGMDGFVAVLGQISKGHAVVGEDGVDSVGEGLDSATQKVRAVHLSHVIPEFHIGELGNPVNGQKHVELALGQAQLGNVDVHVTDFGWRKLAPPCGFDIARWQPRDAMPEQTAVQT